MESAAALEGRVKGRALVLVPGFVTLKAVGVLASLVSSEESRTEGT